MFDLHREILDTLKRVETLAFARTTFADVRLRQKYFLKIKEEFANLFAICTLDEKDPRHPQLTRLWVQVLAEDPGFLLYLYPPFAVALTGQAHMQLFHEELAKPRTIEVRQVKHLTVVK